MPHRDSARLTSSSAGMASPSGRLMASHAFACLRERDGEAGIRLTLSGELDIAGTRELDRALLEAQDSAHAVTLDLSQLTFMDCRSLSVLAAAAVRARASDDRFDVVRGPPHVNRLFELTGMTGLL
jgi:anti-anti-sigma factor